jgi:CheY-like chemotaxis protein
MNLVIQGAEHHFLTFIERLKANPSGWIACTFSFSKKLDHNAIVSRRAFIKSDLNKLKQESTAFLNDFKQYAERLPHCHMYQFADHDIIVLCRPEGELEQKTVRSILEEATAQFDRGFCDYGFLTKELGLFAKVADHKLLTMRKMHAYEMISDDHYVETIDLRRKKRDDPVVLVVEDDRFTASYISNFLRDYDVIVARNGEDAVLKYLEYAPDAVFLDVHLPGMNGHQVLQSIRAADPDAFVVMLSVDTAASNILQASESGATSYLKKPFSRERVLNTLRLSPFIRYSKGILPVEQRDRI